MQNHFLNQIPLPEGSNMRGRPMMANEQMNGYHQQKPDERDEIPEEQYRPWKYRDARKLTPEEIYDIERELFVGDLSFFCKEQHLFQLFGQLGPVHKIRIRRNESRDQSLLYGFVKMQKPEHAKNAVTALHGYLFMGRNLR